MIRLIENRKQRDKRNETKLIAHGDGDGDGENLHFMAPKRNSRHLENVIPTLRAPHIAGLSVELLLQLMILLMHKLKLDERRWRRHPLGNMFVFPLQLLSVCVCVCVSLWPIDI